MCSSHQQFPVVFYTQIYTYLIINLIVIKQYKECDHHMKEQTSPELCTTNLFKHVWYLKDELQKSLKMTRNCHWIVKTWQCQMSDNSHFTLSDLTGPQHHYLWSECLDTWQRHWFNIIFTKYMYEWCICWRCYFVSVSVNKLS